MSTKIILNIKSPNSSTWLQDALVKLRDHNGAIHGISYTDASGQVVFNMPAPVTNDILGKEVNLRKAMWVTIDGVGQVANFDVPASGTVTGAILFDGSPDQMAATQTFTNS